MIQRSPHTRKQEVPLNQPARLRKFIDLPRHLRHHWEIYLILFLSTFLHLANIDKAIFNIDEADLYGLARDAITTGWLPLTSIRASLGNSNPPFMIYLFMLPASLSANPLWGQVMVALCNVGAVLLTYFFVRRYYGRGAGAIAALLYTTSVGAWTFSRHIWNPNLLPLFVMLFLFLLFRGVVERRKGWLCWAILLFGILYQLHASSLYLLLPLAAAVCFAYKTIRPRDLILSAVALLALFAPYILWEFHDHFRDVALLFSTANQQAHIDADALRLYLFYLFPTLANPYLDHVAHMRDVHLLIPDNQSILMQTHLLTLLVWANILPILLLLGGILTAGARIFSLRSTSTTEQQKKPFSRWWSELRASPARQGLALLLLWQIAPLLLLTRHSVVLFVHYLVFFIPGPFILMALCPGHLVALARKFRPSWERNARYGMATFAMVLILAQLIGLGGTIIDIGAGHFQNVMFSDVPDQINALQKADQVARQEHIHRIYLTSFPTYIKMDSMYYLAQQIHTPLEFFTSNTCFILPSPDAGPVVFLTTPGNALAQAFFQQDTNAKLVATSPHLGSSPYQIYVLTAKPEPTSGPYTFKQGLQLLSSHVQLIHNQWLTTRWSVQNTHNPAYRTTYGFQVQMDAVAHTPLHDNPNCTPTSTWAGDQLFIFHTIQPGNTLPAQVTLQASTFRTQPQTLSIGPITGFTDYFNIIDQQTLLTNDGQNSITLPTAVNNTEN